MLVRGEFQRLVRSFLSFRMTDYFALLEEPRRPWADPETLKQKFHALSSALHPDKLDSADAEAKAAANQRFAALNQAYNALRETRDRLDHLLRLEGHPPGIHSLPTESMDLVMKAGQFCRDADRFLAEKAGVTSPMLKMQFFQQGLEWTDRAQALQNEIQSQIAALDSRIRELNPAWEAADGAGAEERAGLLPLRALASLFGFYSYLAKWRAQVGERVVQLAL